MKAADGYGGCRWLLAAMGGELPGEKRRRAREAAENRKLREGMTFAASARLRYRPARGDPYLTSGRPQGPSPHPAPRQPRLGGPAVARRPDPARPCRLRSPKQHTHSSAAISPVRRASETTELGAAGLAGPAAASGFRCGQGRGLASRGDPLPRPLGGPRGGTTSGMWFNLFPARPLRDLASGLADFVPAPGREGFGGNF